MASKNQDFLKFSAYSIKDLITRKLSESSRFTDQIYEGSNLAILIDIFSNMAQCMLYALNHTAGESMFSDTQIYENINRLVKFIGYNPKGVSSATATFVLDQSRYLNSESEIKSYTLYKYSAIDTGKTDSNGKKIYYSTVDTKQTNTNSEYSALFYNGIWKLYPTVFVSDGTEYQKFVLENLQSNTSDPDNPRYTVDRQVNVYVREPGINQKAVEYKMVDEGLFTDNHIDNGSYIYKSTDKIFNLRLNENKQYELTFGNGFTGKIPSAEAQIYIFYLEGNGADGELEPYEVKDKQLQHSRSLFGISEQLYNEIFKSGLETIAADDLPGESIIYSTEARWSNPNSSSTAAAEEDVEDIRRNAPQWFKTGNRLVTASDYEYYVKNRFRDNIVDVKCQNNWQYISTFYQWLYNLGMNGRRANVTHPSLDCYYVNQNKLQKYDLKYADAADGNNVYLWIKMKNDSDLYKEQIDNEILDIKSLTQEAVYLSPLDLNFSFCAADVEIAANYLINDEEFDKNNDSWLEVTLDDNTLYSNNDVKNQIKNIVIDFFNEDNFELGQTIDFSQLASQILNVNAVSRIRTVYRNPDDGTTRIVNGISFATWTPTVIDLGDDMDVSSVSRTLEAFQFPKLYRSADLQSKIKVIRKSISSVNTVQY